MSEKAAAQREPKTKPIKSEGKVCLLTPGQPSTNPRLVKEADTLAAAGFDVTVIYAYWADWASKADIELLKSRTWLHARVGGAPGEQPLRYWFTRLRHGLSQRASGPVLRWLVPRNWRLSRVTPELVGAAKRLQADLYIAHNLGALPAAVAGARKCGSRAGFDAEDFHSDMVSDEMTSTDNLAQDIESRYLPRCGYVTAASPGLSQAYAAKYRITPPVPILNVFPVEERPLQFRPTDPTGPLRLYWFSQTIGSARGLEDAIRAMGMLATPHVELYLQGQWAPGYQQEMESVAAAAGLKSHQVVHLEPEAPSEIVRRASTYDVGLALEQSKIQNRDLTITNKVFTYILAGNAIAATATTGQTPIIDRIAPAGVCYEPGDARALAEFLEVWLRDRSALQIARQTSWDWGTRRYNWDLEKNRFLGVIDQALGRPASQTAEPTRTK
jgi:hypothetical protein